jgi:hypothetical protein
MAPILRVGLAESQRDHDPRWDGAIHPVGWSYDVVSMSGWSLVQNAGESWEHARWRSR